MDASFSARAAQYAEAQMLDLFEAFAPAGWVDGDDGLKVPTYESMGTTVGKIQGTSGTSKDGSGREVVIGAAVRTVVVGGLHIPIRAALPDAGEYGIGWEYVLITPGPVTDPALLNTRWLVVEAHMKSFATARRLDVAQVS